MRCGFAMAALVVGVVGFVSPGQAQSGLPCDKFYRNADGSWVATRNVDVFPGGSRVTVREGSVLRSGASFLGMDLADDLERECKSVSPTASDTPQVELPKIADPATGNIDVQKLTCGQLASTYQEDADVLLLWASGWHSGLAKKNAINVQKLKDGMHKVIVYCKANKERLIVQAMDVVMKDAR